MQKEHTMTSITVDSVAELKNALASISRIRETGAGQPIAVKLRGGDYHFAETIEIGAAENRIIIEPYGNERVRFIGGIRLNGFRRDTYNGHDCLSAKLPACVRPFSDFYVNGKLMDLIRIYFQDTAAKGIMARNQLIELATASLSDLMKEHPEHRAEAKQDLQLLNAQKMGEHEAEIEKIKNVFLAILRDIKKDMDNREQPGEAVTAAMFQTMQETMKDHQQELLSMDDVTAMIAGQIGKFLPMDEETAGQFRQLAKRMMEQVGK